MRLAWLTDIHLNFLSPPKRQSFYEKLNDCNVDAALLSGDISEAPQLRNHLEELAHTCEFPLYFVLGNHDYYRSSIKKTRWESTRLNNEFKNLFWLPCSGLVELNHSTVLCGHGGWADAGYGDFEKSSIIMSDYRLIKELAETHEPLRKKLENLGKEGSQYLAPLIESATKKYQRILIVTHIPPFPQACLYKGVQCSDEWLPHLSCKAMGEMLLDVCTRNSHCQFEVYAGHIHYRSLIRPLPNLTVQVGSAIYGDPKVEKVITVN